MEHSLQALRPRRSLGTESIDIFTLDHTCTEGCDTDGNLVRDCEKSVRNHGNLARNQKSGP